jgi:hypothetical protein
MGRRAMMRLGMHGGMDETESAHRRRRRLPQGKHMEMTARERAKASVKKGRREAADVKMTDRGHDAEDWSENASNLYWEDLHWQDLMIRELSECSNCYVCECSCKSYHAYMENCLIEALDEELREVWAADQMWQKSGAKWVGRIPLPRINKDV